jgi:hypothetical protein
MHTPQEAVDELEYVVRKRGFKVVLFPSYVNSERRIQSPVPGHHRRA